MGIIAKITDKGLNLECYIKIDSVRAGMGEDGKISCCCSIWANADIRANDTTGENMLFGNKFYHIPDTGVQNAGSIIEACYPLLQEYLKGSPDDNTYGKNIKEQLG